VANDENYKIVSMVATGGTAELYKAVQTSLDRIVAIKQLHNHLTEDENFTRRFILEAKAAASLDHENIVKIIDFGAGDGAYRMVMEFIEGESLRDILDRWRQIPEPLVLAIAYQTCLGLEHAHAKGIIHRDIKPGNIMLTATGRVKITDFGLAKLTQMPTQHTAANSILGTPAYMSPEQAFGESVDLRSDLFSLGIMLYECLTGHQPFHGDNYMGVIQNIIKQNAPHPSKFNVELSPGVETILLKLMNKARDARFQSAGDLKKAIEEHLGLEALRQATENLKSLLITDGATIVLPKTEQARRTRRRLRRGFTAALVGGALCATVAAVYVLTPDTIRGFIDEAIGFSGRAAQNEPVVQRGDLLSAGLLEGHVDPVFPDSLVRETTGNVAEAAETHTVTKAVQPAAEPTQVETASETPPETPAADVTASTPGITAAAEQSEPKPPRVESPVAAVKKGWLTIRTEPAAEIYIDGEYIGDAPASRIELPSGSHTLECRTPKHDPYRETINITTGELSTRNIVLQRLVGRISLSTIDGAEVFVDGVLVGVTPLADPIELDAGQHQLTVKKAGYHVWNNVVTLDEKQILPLKITLSVIY
jgi:tRNA A-37 threonylcarbamoyl transferase component Bud32